MQGRVDSISLHPFYGQVVFIYTQAAYPATPLSFKRSSVGYTTPNREPTGQRFYTSDPVTNVYTDMSPNPGRLFNLSTSLYNHIPLLRTGVC